MKIAGKTQDFYGKYLGINQIGQYLNHNLEKNLHSLFFLLQSRSLICQNCVDSTLQISGNRKYESWRDLLEWDLHRKLGTQKYQNGPVDGWGQSITTKVQDRSTTMSGSFIWGHSGVGWGWWCFPIKHYGHIFIAAQYTSCTFVRVEDCMFIQKSI